MSSVFALELKQLGDSKLGIIWNDNHHSLYSVRNLRLECPCAACVDEWTHKKLLKDDNVPQDIHPIRIESVGRYALRVDWTDGHNTGIYPFEKLRKLCECPPCQSR